MAHTASAKKRIRQTEKKRRINSDYRSTMRTAIKKFLIAADAKDLEKSTELYKAAVTIISTISSKGVIHKNQATRKVYRLTLKLHSVK